MIRLYDLFKSFYIVQLQTLKLFSVFIHIKNELYNGRKLKRKYNCSIIFVIEIRANYRQQNRNLKGNEKAQLQGRTTNFLYCNSNTIL